MSPREITVFQAGHAVVMEQGRVVLDAHGAAQRDHLAAPVLGTFWPFVTTPDMRLRSPTAGIRRVALSRPAMTLAELITAQPGAAVQITAVADRAGAAPERYAATIVGLTQRSAAEIASQTRHAEEGVLPRIGDVVLLRTAEGVKALPMARVQDVTVAEITERPFVDHQ